MSDPFALYNENQTPENRAICDRLLSEVDRHLPEADRKIWHGAPVWFLNDNPIVGYHVLKRCVRLLFWSGQSFDEPGLAPEGSFKAAEARYTSVDQIDADAIARWVPKARDIQWNYRDIRKNKGLTNRIS
ncbi:MAG: DUF1801 domain-containing protein [Thermomicrobiales bacterium]|nr:DUF1801 domain-containing protein [Thermomicrobiales bacterium]